MAAKKKLVLPEARENMAKFLSSAIVKRIHFMLHELRVDGGALKKIGELIEKQTILVYEDVPKSEMDDAYAIYDSEKNIMLLNDELDPYEDPLAHTAAGAILHESVHALHDYKRVKCTYWHGEVAAYVAEFIYYRYVGYEHPQKNEDFPQEIFRLIDTYKLDKRNVVLHWELFSPAMRLLMEEYSEFARKESPWNKIMKMDGISPRKPRSINGDEGCGVARQPGPLGLRKNSLPSNERSRRGPLGLA